MNYNVDKNGFYGDFGGAFIPEMLYQNIDELKKNYKKITSDKKFQSEFTKLLHDYVGRPTPLYFAKRLSEKYKTIFFLAAFSYGSLSESILESSLTDTYGSPL